MLKALLLFLMNLALAAMATAQTNLVLNGSFEDTISCDLPVIGIRKAAHWYTANSASPDIWDADLERECGSPLDPDGFPGWWYIAPYEGLRHAGAYYWDGPNSSNTREYPMTRLSSPLVSGMYYEVSLACVLRGTFEFAVDHIGVWFGADSLYEPDPDWLNVVPQLKLRDPQQPYLAETAVWTLLKDTMLAVGGEQWLVIGNFDVADSVNGISAYPDGLNESAYYYLDAVSVKLVDRASSISESEMVVSWSQDGLWVQWPPSVPVMELSLFDVRGRSVAHMSTEPGAGRQQMRLPSLAPGVYIVQARGSKGQITARTIKSEGMP